MEEEKIKTESEKNLIETTNDSIDKGINTFKTIYSRLLIYIVGGVGLIVLFLVIFLVSYNGKIIETKNYSGTNNGSFLVYASPTKDSVIEYNITDKLSVFVKITNIVKIKGVGTKAYYEIYTKENADTYKGNYIWLDDDGAFKLTYTNLGDNFIYVDYTVNGYTLYVFDINGDLTVLDDLDSYGGLYIKNYVVENDKLILNASRRDADDYIFYEDNHISTSICNFNEKTIDKSMSISATYTYSLFNGTINVDNPKIDNVIDYETFSNENRSIYCQEMVE